jgi:integrase
MFALAPTQQQLVWSKTTCSWLAGRDVRRSGRRFTSAPMDGSVQPTPMPWDFPVPRPIWSAPRSDSDLVFPRADGTPTNPDAFSQSFDRLVARSALSRIRLHDLRHTHASILLKAGFR